MTSRVLLPLFALFLAFLPACGESADDSGSLPDDRGAARPVSDDAVWGSAGGNSSGNAGSTFSVVGGASASAGNSGVTKGGGAAGTSSLSPPPATWNSAKSAAISEAQLQTEYATWKLAHVEACANGSLVVVDEGAVASQAIAFGMLLSVAMSDQVLFDGLWKYYQDHLDKNGLMNWTTSKCEAPGNNNAFAATGADLDATMALLQASSRWPGTTAGYRAKAETLAAKIVQFEIDMCDGRRILRPGDAVGGCSDGSKPLINPSYF